MNATGCCASMRSTSCAPERWMRPWSCWNPSGRPCAIERDDLAVEDERPPGARRRACSSAARSRETATSSRCRAATRGARRRGRATASAPRARGCRRTSARRRAVLVSGGSASVASIGRAAPGFSRQIIQRKRNRKGRLPSIRRLTTAGRAGGGCPDSASDPISEYSVIDCVHLQPSARINQLSFGIRQSLPERHNRDGRALFSIGSRDVRATGSASQGGPCSFVQRYGPGGKRR